MRIHYENKNVRSGDMCVKKANCPSAGAPAAAPAPQPAAMPQTPTPARSVLPSCSIYFDQNPIAPSDSTYINWSSSNAESLYISNIGYVTLRGQARITPSATTRYSGTVTGGRGTDASCSATLVIGSVECPDGFTRQADECVLIQSCTNTPRCQGDDIVNSCTGEVMSRCDWACASGACNAVPAPTATLSAVPLLVRSGETTVVSWSSQNTDSCTVSGTNGDSWAGVSSSGRTTSPIIGQTVYSLHCIGYAGAVPSTVDKQVIVNIIPVFQEE